MTVDYAMLDANLPHTITIESITTRDRYGKVINGNAKTYRCYTVERRSRFINGEGEQVTVNRQSYVNTGGDTISEGSKCTFHDGTTRPLVGIEAYDDITGKKAIYVLGFS